MSCMQGNKLVSVIMPAFNAELTVARALKSVLDQTYTNFELFINSMVLYSFLIKKAFCTLLIKL